MKEIDIINIFRRADTRQLKYLTLDLIKESYDPRLLAELAEKYGISQKFGYLAEITAIAADKNRLKESSKLYKLVNLLYKKFTSWQSLHSDLPEYAKNLIKNDSSSKLNNKWKIYSTWEPSSLDDWIDLYITEKYATASRR